MKYIVIPLILILLLLSNCSGKNKKILPENISRHEKWIADLNYFENEFLDKSKTYPKDSVTACKSALKVLKSGIDSLSDNQIILEISRCIAMAHNGHTTMHLSRMKKIPLRFFWFSDGLFIIKSTAKYTEYLGAKVIEINSINIENVQKALNPYLSGNDNWKQYTGTDCLSSPEILNAIGISPEDSMKLTIALKSDTLSMWFKTLEVKDQKYVYNAWENLYPVDTLNYSGCEWRHVISNSANAPLYLQYPDKGAFYTIIDSLKMAYININTTWDRGVDLDKVIDKFLDTIKITPVKSIICDLRYNTGGNFFLTLNLAKKMPKYLVYNSKIYLITSNITFSAGLVTAARIKYFAKDKIVVVGEQVGDDLKFWAERKTVTLPYCGLELQDSKFMHDWANDKFIPFRTYWFNFLFGVAVNDLNVDKEIKPTFDDYYNKKDPIFDWIVKQN